MELTKQKPFPHIKMSSNSKQTTMIVKFDETSDEIECCAHSWCNGDCGFPALVCYINGKQHKCYGDMTAMGRVVQPWRLEWKGTVVEIPLELSARLIEMWWL